MPQVGNEARPLVLKGQNRNKNRIMGLKKYDNQKYSEGWDRIFNKKHETEFDVCRRKNKTFSMDQD